MQKKSDENIFKMLIGIIITIVLLSDITWIASIFTESWDVLKILSTVTITIEVILLLIYIGIFVSKKNRKDFIRDWKEYRKNNKVLLIIIAVFFTLLAIITSYLKLNSL